MKCWNYFYSFLFMVFGLLVGSLIINEKNSVSAVSSVSYTVDSNFAGGYLCHNGSPDAPVLIDVNCSDYSYWSVQWSAQNNPSSSQTLRVTSLGGTSNYPLRISTFSLFSLDVSSLYVYSGNFTPSNFTSFVLTLYDGLPGSSSGIVPSGSLSITANGTYDVTNYAEAVVEVPDTETIIQGDYHDDLVNIYKAILICGGVVLVIYFFYCIYRMFIPTFGGKK